MNKTGPGTRSPPALGNISASFENMVRPISIFQYKVAAAYTPPLLACRFAAAEVPQRASNIITAIRKQPLLSNSARFSAALDSVNRCCEALPPNDATTESMNEFCLRLCDSVEHASNELSQLVDVQRASVINLRSCGEDRALESLFGTLNAVQYDLIGCRTLVNDTAARCVGRAGAASTVNPAELAEKTAEHVRAFAVEKFGAAPEVLITSSCVPQGARAASCLVIPAYLKFALVELLKNAIGASVERFGAAALDDAPPVRVIISEDRSYVGFCVSDHAGGIPGRPGAALAFPYFFSMSAPPVQDSYHYSRTHGAPFSGFGLGLARASLYARHLGGSLSLVSQPGRGVDAHLIVDRTGTASRDVWPG